MLTQTHQWTWSKWRTCYSCPVVTVLTVRGLYQRCCESMAERRKHWFVYLFSHCFLVWVSTEWVFEEVLKRDGELVAIGADERCERCETWTRGVSSGNWRGVGERGINREADKKEVLGGRNHCGESDVAVTFSSFPSFLLSFSRWGTGEKVGMKFVCERNTLPLGYKQKEMQPEK